ncbi:SigE-dependent sporulation protein [Halobacillus litoralis]|uniref:SigE-dependent sporulation protein n=1 Tax=Halobacillus litoralis TaxID=45668 RepID=A0A845E851_9BACI|nr:sporulation YhaL family protein [Halobacillus litoralis]MYL51152.1 SigE-dependent sporulation protein [Halobacillus litoralis]
MLFGLPIWVFLCIVFIFISGYMAIRAMRAEHNLEQEYIEREGQVYLKRMEKEKERREKRDAMMSE